jgi:PAS domain S-box-containing protein
MQDITVRKRAEVEARELAREVIDLYQNAPCGYHSLDADGRFVRINDTELGWLGYPRDELLGRKITDILTPASQRLFNTSFPLLRLHGRQNNIEHEMLRKDGSILPVLLNATAILDTRGSFVASRATVIDMTEQRNAAAERRRQEARHVQISRHMIDLQEEERRGLALEVHDVVSPNLAAVLINLGIIEAGLTQEALKHLGERLHDVRQLIHETNHSLRNICANLRPSMLDYAGLHAAVDNYVQQFTARTGLPVEIVPGHRDGRLPSDVEILLFRIIQEALANCAKHAHASRVILELQHDCEHADLIITDDGVGFDPDALIATGRKPGLGLLTMGERAEFAGGEFRLESRPGQGTRISVKI